MPAYTQHERLVRPRERAYALAAVAVVQAGLAFALISGLHVTASSSAELVQRLIDITLPKPPPPPPPPPPQKPQHHQASAPKAEPVKIGGSPGPKPAHAPPSVTPVVAVRPSAAASGGGTGTGPALGSGVGGGSGGNGYGGGEGGSDSELIAGDFFDSDYPAALGRAGIGGRVTVAFTVQVNGRATGCHVTRTSGVPQLDSLTCGIIEQRFRFRPATDDYGRPEPDEGDYTRDWIPPRG